METIDITDLITRMRGGDIGALSRVLTQLERQSATVPELIAGLKPFLGHCVVVGFTGPPGAGKSTLVSAYISVLRAGGRTVGVVAVDPSSPISGGALLGDRIRMAVHTVDDGVFVRSISSRGHVGGLSPAAVRLIDGFDGAGRDVVILETVGAGQSEIDVAEIADVRIVLNAPNLGDDIQAMKAGILDIADILVVNKSDLAGADNTVRQLRAAVSLGFSGHETPILQTVATTGEGVDELARKIDMITDHLTTTPGERRQKRARQLIAWAAGDLINRLVKRGEGEAFDLLCDDVLGGKIAPEEALRRLLNDG